MHVPDYKVWKKFQPVNTNSIFVAVVLLAFIGLVDRTFAEDESFGAFRAIVPLAHRRAISDRNDESFLTPSFYLERCLTQKINCNFGLLFLKSYRNSYWKYTGGGRSGTGRSGTRLICLVGEPTQMTFKRLSQLTHHQFISEKMREILHEPLQIPVQRNLNNSKFNSFCWLGVNFFLSHFDHHPV